MKMKKYMALAAATALALTACSTGNDDASGTSASAGSETTSASGASNTEATQVTTSMYPVSYLVSEIGGDRVNIQDLTPPGGDAHGLELSPREIADMEKSEALFYIGHLSASMDEAASTVDVAHIVDLGEHADLKSPEELGVEPHDHDHDHEGHDHEGHDHDHDHEGHDHEGHDHAHEGHDHDHGGIDPHFWTDPARMAMVVPTIVETLSDIDPQGAEQFKTEGQRVSSELEALAAKYEDALADERCESQTFVVTHEAFAYLADSNDLTQLGIAGIDPDTEPSPARIREVAALMSESGTDTIFATSSSERAGAEALANETNSSVELLNPVASKPEGGDYISAMDENLAKLGSAMGCK